MSRKNIAAGNWKMNTVLEEGIALANGVVSDAPFTSTVIFAPPSIQLNSISEVVKEHSNVHLAAQNCHYAKSGAYTGETSVDQLKSVGVEYVLVGHSERREYFNESDEILAKKVDAVLEGELQVIFCCGEPLNIREKEGQVEYVKSQLKNGLFHIEANKMSEIVIAYEPIWAIGTGVTASPEQAQEMHKEIRSMVANQYNVEIAENVSILYGGSVKPSNAVTIFSQPDVDGGLVGGASLKANDFIQIIKAF